MTDTANNPTTENEFHWHPFNGDGNSLIKELNLPEAPPWRNFSRAIPNSDDERWEKLIKVASNKDLTRGSKFRLQKFEPKVENPEINLKEKERKQREQHRKKIDMTIAGVNSALCLRRPLLVTGRPGSGKTSLAYALAYQLNLGSVLKWPITARTNLQEGLYRYDAIARLQENQKDIGSYITLGPLGTAFLPSKLPRVLLVDEIDKSDINLPNDLLNLFEEGEYQIPELKRWFKQNKGESTRVFTDDKGKDEKTDEDLDFSVELKSGLVGCNAFPIVVMTSNGERDFPPAFKRRCIRINMPNPMKDNLFSIVDAHMQGEFAQSIEKIEPLIDNFLQKKDVATDQLLNAIYMSSGITDSDITPQDLEELLFKALNDTGGLG